MPAPLDEITQHDMNTNTKIRKAMRDNERALLKRIREGEKTGDYWNPLRGYSIGMATWNALDRLKKAKKVRAKHSAKHFLGYVIKK